MFKKSCDKRFHFLFCLRHYNFQRWSRGHKVRGQGHKKNPRPKPRTIWSLGLVWSGQHKQSHSLCNSITTDKITCVVFEVPCKDCDFVFVGQTKRDLNSRLKEHQKAIKQQKPENSALCEHVILLDHVIDWANSRILKTESNFSKRLTAESWFILSRPKVINRSDGESFPISLSFFALMS